jgi:hypothetical protein
MDPSGPVKVLQPSKQYDELYRRAADARVSIPEAARRDLRRAPREDQDGED